MNACLILLTGAVLLCGGCQNAADKDAADKKIAAAGEAAARAGAKVAAMTAARAAAARGEAATGDAAAGRAEEALVGLLCSSPELMDDIEGDMCLLEALSGEGGERREVSRHLLVARSRYRALLQKELPLRGVAYAEFIRYVSGLLPGQVTPARRRSLRRLISSKCTGDRELVEKTVGGLARFCAGAEPQ